MSPFQSKAQQGFLEAKKPAVAKEFEAKTPKAAYKNLPEKKAPAKGAIKGRKKMSSSDGDMYM